MGRKYVRDKAGRFAPKGGGTKGKGGKMGKSTKNVKARAAYKKASGKLRSMKKISGGAKDAKDRKFWNKSLGGAKSGMTRVTNRLTNKRAAKSGLKKTLSSQKTAATKAKFKSKTTKGRAAKAEWKAARRADRKGGIGEGRAQDRNQKRVIKKQTGKTAYSQGFRKTPAKTKAPRAGSKTKVQKIRAKIDKKKFANKELRGSEFKGVKKRQSKGEKAVANRKKPERVRARKREEQGLALAGRKAYRKGPGAAERKAAVTGKTWKAKPNAAKAKYKKAKTAAKTAERFSQVDRGTKDARKGAAAKGKFTKLKKSMSKGATKGKGYGLSKKGQEAKKRFTELKRERGGATKGKGTAAQKRAGIGYRKTQAALGKKTKGRTPKGRLPGGESLKQQMKAAPKQSFRGKGSKAQRRIKALRDAKNLRNAAKASNTPKGAKKNYTKRANEIAKATRTPKATKGRSAKAQYKKLSGNARKNFRIGDARRGKSPAEIRGKHNLSRGVKKTKGAKKYIDTRNTEYPMFQRFKKSELKRKFKL